MKKCEAEMDDLLQTTSVVEMLSSVTRNVFPSNGEDPWFFPGQNHR